MDGDKVLDTNPNTNYLALFQQIHNQALLKNEETQKHWTKQKEEYETLQQHLSVLPNDLTKDVMVPVGPKALMKGKMVHTNEILVCLGEGWFVKRSAAQAVEICKRRLTLCNDMLTALDKEQQLLSSRTIVPHENEAFGGRGEIIEVCDEKEVAEWKVEHRQKEKGYRKQLAELHQKEKTPINSEETLWKRLDELELQEELEDELERLHQDNDEEEDDDSSDVSDEASPEEDEVEMNVLMSDSIRGRNGLIGKKVIIENIDKPIRSRRSSAENEVSFADNELIEEIYEPVEGKPNTKGRRVSFADVQPTPDEENCEEENEDKPSSSGRRVSFADVQPEVVSNKEGEGEKTAHSPNQEQSPTDVSEENKIIKQGPKSILKNKGYNTSKSTSEESNISDGDVDPVIVPPPVSSDVVEHNPEVMEQVEAASKRPMSRFRAARKSSKR